MRSPRTSVLAAALVSLAPALHAQTVDDGVMMHRGSLCTGFMYTHERWDEYWEGELKRVNGNIGAITTETVAWAGIYGITDRINVLASVPFVWTHASQGVLRGQHGFQDFSFAAKYTLLQTAFTSKGSLRTILVAQAGGPIGDYTPDYYPLSLGSASNVLSGRMTVSFQAHAKWFVEGSAAYARRGDVTLDRPYYFTDDTLYMSDQVSLPDVFDYKLSAGWSGKNLYVPVSFVQRITRGGGDIRRQDVPFVSNRMNFSKVDAVVLYALPMARNLSLRAEGAYTVDGRNVGQATAVSAGLLYTFHF